MDKLLGDKTQLEELIDYISSPKAIISLCIIGAAFLLWFAVRKGHKRYVASGKAKGEKATLVRVMFGIIRFAILTLTLITVLQINGINVNSLVTGLGILSAMVGFALQDVLKDTIMGIHIISDHFYSIGDVVKYENIEGVIIGFTMKTTTIRSIYDGTITTVCNRNISEITKMPKSTMVDIDLPLSYDEDTRKVHALLGEVCEKIGKLEGIDKSIYKGTQEFSQSAVIYKLRFFCPPEFKPDRTRDAMRVIQDSLNEANIRIPYNQIDVHTDPAVQKKQQ